MEGHHVDAYSERQGVCNKATLDLGEVEYDVGFSVGFLAGFEFQSSRCGDVLSHRVHTIPG